MFAQSPPASRLSCAPVRRAASGSRRLSETRQPELKRVDQVGPHEAGRPVAAAGRRRDLLTETALLSRSARGAERAKAALQRLASLERLAAGSRAARKPTTSTASSTATSAASA